MYRVAQCKSGHFLMVARACKLPRIDVNNENRDTKAVDKKYNIDSLQHESRKFLYKLTYNADRKISSWTSAKRKKKHSGEV